MDSLTNSDVACDRIWKIYNIGFTHGCRQEKWNWTFTLVIKQCSVRFTVSFPLSSSKLYHFECYAEHGFYFALHASCWARRLNNSSSAFPVVKWLFTFEHWSHWMHVHLCYWQAWMHQSQCPNSRKKLRISHYYVFTSKCTWLIRMQFRVFPPCSLRGEAVM